MMEGAMEETQPHQDISWSREQWEESPLAFPISLLFLPLFSHCLRSGRSQLIQETVGPASLRFRAGQMRKDKDCIALGPTPCLIRPIGTSLGSSSKYFALWCSTPYKALPESSSRLESLRYLASSSQYSWPLFFFNALSMLQRLS